MALKAKISSLTDVPESLRSEYKREGDSYVLDVEGVGGLSLEDVTGLRSALSKERTTREALEGKVSKFGDLTPESLADMRARLDVFTKLDPSKDAERIAEEKMKSRELSLIEKHTQELKQSQEKSSRFEKLAVKHLHDSELSRALLSQKVKPSMVDLLAEKMKKLTVLEINDDGTAAIKVFSDDGVTPRILDGKGTAATVENLAEDFRIRYPECFEGLGHSGGGTGTKSSSGGGSSAKTYAECKTAEDRAQWLKTNVK